MLLLNIWFYVNWTIIGVISTHSKLLLEHCDKKDKYTIYSSSKTFVKLRYKLFV